MPRKKIIDSKSCKFSLDVNGDNKEVLDELTVNYNIKYGPMINKIISTFCRMPGSIRKVIEKACLNEYNRLTEELENVTEEFHRQPLEKERDSYMDILQLINKGTYEFSDAESDVKKMKKICLADGYLIIPADWIVVNPERASSSRYAAVLECRNSEKYGVPHFIYLNNFKYGRDYTDSMEEEFYSLCKKKWGKFTEIQKLSNKNKLVPDPDNKGQYLNIKEYLAAPIIGLFSIEEQGERPYGEAPYGAMIVRT